MTIIDSLFRLQRIADESSKTNQKIKTAVKEISLKIIEMLKYSNAFEFEKDDKLYRLPFLVETEQKESKFLSSIKNVKDTDTIINCLYLHTKKGEFILSYEKNFSELQRNILNQNDCNIYDCIKFAKLINAGFINQLANYLSEKIENISNDFLILTGINTASKEYVKSSSYFDFLD